MGEGGEEARGEGEVDEDDEGPDGGEEHEVVFGGGEDVGCDWEGGALVGLWGWFERMGRERERREERTVSGESEDYDGEEGLDGAKRDEYYVEHVCL